MPSTGKRGSSLHKQLVRIPRMVRQLRNWGRSSSTLQSSQNCGSHFLRLASSTFSTGACRKL